MQISQDTIVTMTPGWRAVGKTEKQRKLRRFCDIQDLVPYYPGKMRTDALAQCTETTLTTTSRYIVDKIRFNAMDPLLRYDVPAVTVAQASLLRDERFFSRGRFMWCKLSAS